MTPKINVSDIAQVFKKILEKLNIDKISEFEFDDDEYWVVLTEEWSDFDVPPDAAVGSLSDDCNFIKEVARNNELISYLELERLASILRAMSKQLTN